MEAKELKKTHPLYTNYIEEWNRNLAAYQGTDALLKWGALKRHARESEDNFRKRQQEAYSYNYSKSIVNLFTHYLFQKPAKRQMGDLGEDELWKDFIDDCDLYATNFDSFLIQSSQLAGALGHVGIFIDRPTVQTKTRADDRQGRVYPYLSIYLPAFILDWKIERNDMTKRPELTYLKLKDEDGRFRIWDQEKWEIWEIDSKQDDQGILIDSGANELKVIPFVWLLNEKGLYRNIGVSDITDISRIDISILRNLSHGEEVIEYAAFPMMRKPMALPTHGSAKETIDVVGVRSILEFDPTQPESKPDWLEARIQEPIQAILSWVEKKIEEIYRSSHAGSISGQLKQSKSGIALRYEFMQVNSKLTAKADNLKEAELKIIWYWLLWQDQTKWYDEIIIDRPKDFSLEELENELKNILTAKAIIQSEKFQRFCQKTVSRMTFPKMEADVQNEIDEEIESLNNLKIPSFEDE